jgi:hypothetical protein
MQIEAGVGSANRVPLSAGRSACCGRYQAGSSLRRAQRQLPRLLLPSNAGHLASHRNGSRCYAPRRILSRGIG